MPKPPLLAALVALMLLAPAGASAASDGRYRAEIRRFADILATVDARRTRYFGADASYGEPGSEINNLASDFFYQRIKDSGVVERLVRRPYPHGPGADVRATVRGFVAGWNAYLRRTGVDHLPDPRCRGAAWVKPIRASQLYRRFYQLALRASA